MNTLSKVRITQKDRWQNQRCHVLFFLNQKGHNFFFTIFGNQRKPRKAWNRLEAIPYNITNTHHWFQCLISNFMNCLIGTTELGHACGCFMLQKGLRHKQSNCLSACMQIVFAVSCMFLKLSTQTPWVDNVNEWQVNGGFAQIWL